MKINQITESSAGATSSGAVASVAMPMGKVQKRAGSLFKGKKTKKKFYENTSLESEIKEAFEDKLQEDDIIVVPGMRRMKDTSFIPHKADRRDHEVEMARSDLYAAAKDAMRIFQILKNRSEDDGLMGWQQSYITLAADYLNSVADSVEYNAHMNEMTGGVLAGGMSNFEENNVNEISDFKKKEIEYELRNEPKNNYQVSIDGRAWKVFADKSHAEAVARKLRSKGKKAEVHLTGARADVNEAGDMNYWVYNEKENQYYGPYSSESAAKQSGRMDIHSEIRKVPSRIRNPRTVEPSATRMANVRKGTVGGTKISEKVKK